METFAGQQIKGYELQERIAAGGFGAVYRAYQSTVGREVAVKVILPSLANKPDFIRRFECEAQIIARLEHMNIVPLYDYWRDPSGAYLVMRYLRGGSLHHYLRTQGKLTIEEAFNIMAQVAQGLQVAHRNQIVHRDIKPGNILLDEDGNGYLGDFGIAKDYTDAQNITEADNMIGSPEYLAPEQALSEAVTPQTDIYSLGVVLYEMLTGEHPFSGSGEPKLTYIYKHLSELLPAVSTLDNKISEDVNGVIQRATAKDPKARFKTVLDMVEALRQAAQLDAPPTPISLVELLTPREQEVMQLIIDNKTNREIAAILVITEGTVKQYITSIYRKLKVRSRVQAITRARDLNFVIRKPEVIVTTGHLPEPENPYKGLRAFQPADAQNFFGREKLTKKLLSRLQEQVEYQRFLPVVGPSGSGKSSVVRAGLTPALWRGDIPGSENWYVIDMLPGTNPIDELEVALFKVATDKAMNLRAQLERDKRGLIRVANMILPDDGSELLVIIDQFEEVFTLMQNEEERLHFLALLIEAVTDKRSRVRVIITLRADYYDRPLQYPEFGELIRSRVETVLPLSADELERAISEPAQREGVSFEEGLVSRIVSDVHYQPGALPLLQYALTELFERRDGRKLTFEAYQAIGGTGGALANRADEIYLEADDTGRELIRQMFLRLVTLGEGAEDTRRRVLRSELLAITQSDVIYRVPTSNDKSVGTAYMLSEKQAVMDEIIDLYAASRLLSLDNDPSTRQPTIEVAHEAILREWDRLRQWLNQSREDIRQERLVAQAAEAWITNQRDKSYLLTGTRLEQVEKWNSITELALTPMESEYIQTSVQAAKAQEIAEAERQKHEKQLERRSIIFLRSLVAVLTIAVLGAFGLTTLAVSNANKAHNNFIAAEQVRLAAQARVLLDNGESTELVALLALRSLSLGYSPEADQALLQAYSSGFPLQSYRHTAAISSNSGILAPDGNHYLVGTNDNKVLMWNVRIGEVDRVFSGHTEFVAEVIVTADGQRMLSSSGDGTVRVWDIETGEPLFILPSHGVSILTLALTPDEHTIITGDTNGLVQVWDYDTRTPISEFQAHDRTIYSLVVTRDGQGIITGSCDNTARLWDIATQTELVRYEGHTDCVRQAALTPDGKYLVTASYDNTARLWDIETGQELIQYRGHTDRVEAVEVSPDGRYLISGSWDRSARLWDIATGETLRIFHGQPDVYGLARFLPNMEQIVISSFNRIEAWNIEAPTEPRILASGFDYTAHITATISLHYMNNSDQLLSVSGRGEVRTWDDEGNLELSLQLPEMLYSQDAVFLEGKRQLVTATTDGRVQIWSLERGQLLREISDVPGQIQQIAATTDESLLATVGEDGFARLWDLETGELIRELAAHDGGIRSVAFSGDGRYLITGGADALAKVWDVHTGELLRTLNGHTDTIGAIAVSSDNQYVVTGSDDTFVILWNLETGAQIRRFAGLNATVRAVAISPDQQRVFGGGDNGVALLWDIDSATIVRQFTGQPTAITEVDFSNDSSRIATSDLAANYIWRTSRDEIATIVCNQLRRDFTAEERITYRIQDDKPTCPNSVTEAVAMQATWTPFPTLAPDAITPVQITPQVGLSTTSDGQPSIMLQTQPVVQFTTGFPIEGGSATLIRTASGIAMTYPARDLPPGNVITIWWVIWERPALCTPPACTLDDVFLTDEAGNFLRDENEYLMLNQPQIDKVGTSLGYATGNVVNDDGTAYFSAYLPLGDTSHIAFGRGLLFPFTSEIHLIARTHGPASTNHSILLQQLNTAWGGCEPFHPPCDDVQAVVFPPVNQ